MWHAQAVFGELVCMCVRGVRADVVSHICEAPLSRARVSRTLSLRFTSLATQGVADGNSGKDATW